MTQKLTRVPTNSPFIESGGEVIINKANLGYDPSQVWTRHKFQFTTLGGGTARVQHQGRGGVFTDLDPTVFSEGDVALINDVSVPAFKVVFTGGGGVGEVHVESRRVDSYERVSG